MNNPSKNLAEYIKKNLRKKYTEESLKWALINQGYSKTIVERAINQAHQEIAKTAPILKEKPIIRHEILDENDEPIEVKKSWLKRIFRV